MLRSLPFALLLMAAGPLHAALEVVVETKVFHIPNVGPRVEVNMAILAGSAVTRFTQAGFSQARVEALTIIEQDGVIKAFAKTEILGAERLDSIQVDLIHQEFFDIAPGSYVLSIELRDLNSTDTTVTHYQAPLAVGTLPPGISASDILMAERFDQASKDEPSKSGYRVVPLLSDYLPQSIGTLAFYAEVYGSDRRFGPDSLYLLTTQIENAETHLVAGGLKQVKRARGVPVEPVFARFDIGLLASGNYLAALEVRDKKGELIIRRESFFQRNNPISFNYDLRSLADFDITNTFAGAFTDPDSLAEHISSLRPIAAPLERKIIDDRWKDRDMDLMQRFFYGFWANRSSDPEAAWRVYRAEVVKVNRLYGCRVQKGYETDRGYVYLKYGPPNTMMDRFNEMDSYPYTIWHYYRAGRYTNRRFVFYQPDLVSSCLQLLHSEVPGEIQNPRWNQILHSRNVAMPNVDTTPVGSQSGERANEFFNQPR
ncbi:MAG: GWxTD domain-containing protein [Flavobacteriales bacterium]|nr:GWxTD domain-containing protein [Flavobacteriales bacterium]MCC6938825.1 GWxTD domain-containing protein [Flavobacteriales bacterium]